MSLQFSLTDGKPLTSIPGFPDHYTGTILNGASASHIIDSFGHIVLQEFVAPQMSLTKMLVHWKEPVRIKCQYNFVSPVLFSRAMNNNSMSELVKGAGDIFLERSVLYTYRKKVVGVNHFRENQENIFLPISPGMSTS